MRGYFHFNLDRYLLRDVKSYLIFWWNGDVLTFFYMVVVSHVYSYVSHRSAWNTLFGGIMGILIVITQYSELTCTWFRLVYSAPFWSILIISCLKISTIQTTDSLTLCISMVAYYFLGSWICKVSGVNHVYSTVHSFHNTSIWSNTQQAFDMFQSFFIWCWQKTNNDCWLFLFYTRIDFPSFLLLLLQIAGQLLNDQALEFYKWDGDLKQLLQNVRDKLNKVAEVCFMKTLNYLHIFSSQSCGI